MPAKKGNKTGRLYSKEYQPKGKGRKLNRIDQFVKEFNLNDETRKISREDATKLILHVLSCSKSALEAMVRNTDLPMFIVCQIKAIEADLSNGRTETVDKLMDRLYGKSTQPMELTGANGMQLIPEGPMSRKAYEKLLRKLKGDTEEE